MNLRNVRFPASTGPAMIGVAIAFAGALVATANYSESAAVTRTPPSAVAENVLISAQSPLHPCAAAMHDVRPDVTLDVYSVDDGFRYEGIVISDPYLRQVAGDYYQFAVDLQGVDGVNRPHFLPDMGLLPSTPWGVWNKANFTVVAGTCETLP